MTATEKTIELRKKLHALIDFMNLDDLELINYLTADLDKSERKVRGNLVPPQVYFNV